ncbi:MAG: ATP-binding protein [Deltaproteobacteria bacterium]|jgi:DNA transposition AAA+ family ATPase|nr:ATP-binding protein [Deltaproteobacteria bacterium]
MQKQIHASGVLPTRNVALLMELTEQLKNRTPGLPGMGTFYGPTGYGKSKAIVFCAISHQAYYIQVKGLWNCKYLLEQILSQMNIQPARTMSPMLEQIGQQLALSGRPLIIDEADLLFRKGMIEVTRDIYESSQGVVILVGEETLPGQLERIERIHGRMLDWVAAQPTDLDDARLFSGYHCPDLDIKDDLLARLIDATHGSARYICTNLARVKEFALVHGLSAISSADYTGGLFTGTPPERRRV